LDSGPPTVPDASRNSSMTYTLTMLKSAALLGFSVTARGSRHMEP